MSEDVKYTRGFIYYLVHAERTAYLQSLVTPADCVVLSSVCCFCSHPSDSLFSLSTSQETSSFICLIAAEILNP